MPGLFLFKAIIFDCDGVLVDSEVLAMRGERRALAELGLTYSREEYMRRFIGMHDDPFIDAVREDFRTRIGAVPADIEDRINAARRAEMKALTAISGAGDALKAARSRGALAVASSSRAHFLENKMKRTGLWDGAAPHIYSADLVEHAKPAPDIFLYAAAKLGLAPDACIAIEDSENGVRAGVAAGMTVWGFLGGGHVTDGHGERLKAAGAASVVNNHADLAANIAG